MKYLIPAAAILVLGTFGAMRRSIDVPKPSQTVVGGIALEPKPAGAPETGRGSSSSSPEPSIATSGGAVASALGPSASASEIPVSEFQEMLDVLRTELGLTGEQEPRIKDALRGRIRDLRECHQAYRKNGVFVPVEYGKQLARMKETWFRNLDGILDSDQHGRFVKLVKEGFFRPGTEFTVDLSTMTVLR